ncbi:MAG: ADP-ribosylation factor-like protein, partial [Cytophagales bacterium]|nr:ADP-ribosylation factor-like protein [Cytophagales bacterium]
MQSKKLAAYDYLEYSTLQYDGVTELFEAAVTYALQGREREIPQFSLAEKKAKQQLQEAISVSHNKPQQENLKRNLVKLLKKHSHKQKKCTIVDLKGLNITEESLTFLLPFIAEIINGMIGLDLSFNRLHKIPSSLIEMFPTIYWLSVEGNQIHTFPPQIVEIEVLHWKGNPLSLIPDAFRNESDWSKMKQYLSSISEKSTSWQDIKLLLVGQEGVGKTTLLNCLKSDKHKADTKVNLSTDGVHITRSIQLESGSDVRFNAWDLGGQEVFYPTHQFFLTSNSVYLLVFNLLEMNSSRMEYWMRLIKSLSQNSRRAPIFIVGTHADHPSLENGVLESRLQEVAVKFSTNSYRGLQTIHAISCKSGMGVVELKQRIVALANQSWFQSRISESWGRLHDMISIKRESGTDKVSWNVYYEWTQECGVPESEIQVCTDFLKDIGCVIHFDDKKTTSADFVILNPQWLAQLMSSLVTFKHNWIKNGTIPLSYIHQHIFAAYPAEIHYQLINLLERFSVVYKSKTDPNT